MPKRKKSNLPNDKKYIYPILKKCHLCIMFIMITENLHDIVVQHEKNLLIYLFKSYLPKVKKIIIRVIFA